MRDEDKPFVLYRKGPMNFTIVPRGARGWLQFSAWMALLVPMMIVFTVFAKANEGTPAFFVGLALFVGATLVWSLAMILWMRARAEVVDVNALLKLKREEDRNRQRGRPPGANRSNH